MPEAPDVMYKYVNVLHNKVIELTNYISLGIKVKKMKLTNKMVDDYKENKY